jgi:hypothetical protein
MPPAAGTKLISPIHLLYLIELFRKDILSFHFFATL